MARFVARRLVGMVAVLFAVSVIVFLVFNVIPNSDPAQRMAGKAATPTLVASINEEWGFEDPLPQQYLKMMENIFTGKVISYEGRENVDQRIAEGIPATFSLCLGAAAIWLFFGLLFGYLSATRAGSLLDRGLTILAITGISIPIFLIGQIFLVYLTYKTEILPSGGYVEFGENPFEWAEHLILPWLTLAILNIGFYSRVLRSNMLDVMNEDYVRTARAKGISERRVLLRHMLRTSMITFVSLFGLDLGVLIGGGALLAEVVFGLPGVGLLTYKSLTSLDLPVIMATVVYGAIFIVIASALVDVAYAYLDPRVRLA
jgi:peptide/nickel transport system permease protein